jgi:hypothetical protein
VQDVRSMQNFREIQSLLTTVNSFRVFAVDEALGLREKEQVKSTDERTDKKDDLNIALLKQQIREKDISSCPFGYGNLRKAGFSDVKLVNELIPFGKEQRSARKNPLFVSLLRCFYEHFDVC